MREERFFESVISVSVSLFTALALSAADLLNLWYLHRNLAGKIHPGSMGSFCVKAGVFSLGWFSNLPISLCISILLLLSLITLSSRPFFSYLMFSAALGGGLYAAIIQGFFFRTGNWYLMDVLFLAVFALSFLILTCRMLRLASWRKVAGSSILSLLFSMFLLHFLAFFPSFSGGLSGSLHAYLPDTIPSVVLYTSPLCPPCRKAEKDLLSLVKRYPSVLVQRPVVLCPEERKKLHASGWGFEARAAEALYRENERSLRKLAGDVEVPVVVLSCGESRVILKGWSEESRNAAEEFLRKAGERLYGGDSSSLLKAEN